MLMKYSFDNMSWNGTIYKFLAALARLHEKEDFSDKKFQEEEDVLRILFEIGTKKLRIPIRKRVVVASLLAEVLWKLGACVNRHVDYFLLSTFDDACITRSSIQFLLDDYFTFETDKGLPLADYEWDFWESVDISEFEKKIYMYSSGSQNHPVMVNRKTAEMVPKAHWWWWL